MSPFWIVRRTCACPNTHELANSQAQATVKAFPRDNMRFSFPEWHEQTMLGKRYLKGRRLLGAIVAQRTAPLPASAHCAHVKLLLKQKQSNYLKGEGIFDKF